jgi:hypothetical protein
LVELFAVVISGINGFLNSDNGDCLTGFISGVVSWGDAGISFKTLRYFIGYHGQSACLAEEPTI